MLSSDDPGFQRRQRPFGGTTYTWFNVMETIGIMSQGDNGVETHSPSIWGDTSPFCRHFLKSRAWVQEIPPSFSLQVSSVYINTASKVKRQEPLWLGQSNMAKVLCFFTRTPNRQPKKTNGSSQRLCLWDCQAQRRLTDQLKKKDCLIGNGQRY